MDKKVKEDHIITQALIHGDRIPHSIHVKEDFFPDQRSYVSELWAFEQTTNVTYYFFTEDIPKDKDSIEKYLIEMKKLIEGEKHYLAIAILEREGIEIYSVTVTVGIDDDLFCEAYM